MAPELNKHAWGLFWAGGGLQSCRDVLVARDGDAKDGSALVPATPEALLRLMLDLEQETPSTARRTFWSRSVASEPAISPTSPNPWRLVAWTSLAWMTVLGLTVAGFLGVLERQEQKLDLLLERTCPTRDGGAR